MNDQIKKKGSDKEKAVLSALFLSVIGIFGRMVS